MLVSLGGRVASATFMLTASNAAVRLLSIITMPILTHLLSADAYGATAMAGTLISLLAVIAIAGMDMSYARAYHTTSGPNGLAVETFVWRYALIAATMAGLMGGGFWLFAADWLHLSEYLGFFVGVGAFLCVIQTMAQVRARLASRYRLLTIAGILSGVITAVVSIGCAMWWRQDASVLLLAMLAGYLIVVLALGLPSLRNLVVAPKLSWGQSKAIFSIGIAGTFTAPMYWVLSSLDRWLLGLMDSASSVGIYSIGYNIAILGTMVNTAIAAVWLPEAAKIFETNRHLANEVLGILAEKIIILLAVVWLAVVAAGGDLLRLLAAEKFHEAVEVIPYIAAAVFFNGVLQIANAGNLLAGKLHKTLVWWSLGALVCIGLNLVLIPVLGRMGAAVTQACAFGVVAGGVWFSSQREFPLVFRHKKLAMGLFALVLVSVCMYPPWSLNPLHSLMLKLPVGVAITFGAAVWVARKDVISMMESAAVRFRMKK